MERSPKGGKAAKKTLLVIACILGALVLLVAAFATTFLIQRCTYEQAQPTATAEPTPTPEPTPMPDRIYDANHKPDFDPEIEKLGMTDSEIMDYGAEYLLREYWLDITPETLAPEYGKVIRHIGLGYSYLVLDGTYYRLGEGDDGKGVLDVIVCDLNWDEIPELLYTYHFGTGSDAQAKIGWFDCADRSDTRSPFAMQNDYLALDESDGRCLLYHATRTVTEDGTFRLHFESLIGELTESEGALYLTLIP